MNMNYKDLVVGKAYQVTKDLGMYGRDSEEITFTPIGSLVYVVEVVDYGFQLTNRIGSQEHSCNSETGTFNFYYDSFFAQYLEEVK
jgi:hypothetical protein